MAEIISPILLTLFYFVLMPLIITVFITFLIFLAVYYSEWRAKPNVNEPSIKPHLEDMPICGNCGALLESDKLKICPDCSRKIQRKEQLITHLESREKQNIVMREM